MSNNYWKKELAINPSYCHPQSTSVFKLLTLVIIIQKKLLQINNLIFSIYVNSRKKFLHVKTAFYLNLYR